MVRATKYAVGFFGLWLIAACSGSSVGERCASQSDCFSGEVCHQERCVLEEDVDFTDDVGVDIDVDTGGGDHDGDSGDETPGPAQDVGGDSDGESDGNSSNNGSAPDGGDGDNDGSADTGAENSSCAFSTSGEFSCNSGHAELESNQRLTLLPEEMDEAGCGLSADPSGEFRHFDDEVWVIRACPDRKHMLRLPLRRCTHRTYPAFVRIEPVEPVCPLDQYTTVSFGHALDRETDNCAELGTDSDCFFEEELDDGGFQWVFKTEAPSSSPSYAWTVYIDVEIEPDAYFEYQLTVSVPPLEQ